MLTPYSIVLCHQMVPLPFSDVISLCLLLPDALLSCLTKFVKLKAIVFIGI